MVDPEARVIHGLLAFLGALRLVVAFALREPLGAEVTVALAFAVLGFGGMVTSWNRRDPRACGDSHRR